MVSLLLSSLHRPVSRLSWVNKSVLTFHRTRVAESFTRPDGENSAIPKLVLYGDEASPPVRFVMMTASILRLEYHFHRIDLFKGENKSEMYTKINALQKVPALAVEGHGVIAESVDIAKYFCMISKDTILIPDQTDDRKMSEFLKNEEMLSFNSKTLFPIDSKIFSGYFAGNWPPDNELIEQWNSSLDYLDRILGASKWLAGGTEMRLCDLCCATTVTSLRLLLPALDRHPHVNTWLKTLERLQFFQNINGAGLRRLKKFVEQIKFQ